MMTLAIVFLIGFGALIVLMAVVGQLGGARPRDGRASEQSSPTDSTGSTTTWGGGSDSSRCDDATSDTANCDSGGSDSGGGDSGGGDSGGGGDGGGSSSD